MEPSKPAYSKHASTLLLYFVKLLRSTSQPLRTILLILQQRGNFQPQNQRSNTRLTWHTTHCQETTSVSLIVVQSTVQRQQQDAKQLSLNIHSNVYTSRYRATTAGIHLLNHGPTQFKSDSLPAAYLAPSAAAAPPPLLLLLPVTGFTKDSVFVADAITLVPHSKPEAFLKCAPHRPQLVTAKASTPAPTTPLSSSQLPGQQHSSRHSLLPRPPRSQHCCCCCCRQLASQKTASWWQRPSL